MPRRVTPEGLVKKAVEDLLKAENIPYWRMNAGDRFTSHPKTGVVYRIRGHKKGTADFLAAPNIKSGPYVIPVFLWIETKDPERGKIEQEQLDFADEVRNRGHYHLFVDYVSILQDWLREMKAR